MKSKKIILIISIIISIIWVGIVIYAYNKKIYENPTNLEVLFDENNEIISINGEKYYNVGYDIYFENDIELIYSIGKASEFTSIYSDNKNTDLILVDYYCDHLDDMIMYAKANFILNDKEIFYYSIDKRNDGIEDKYVISNGKREKYTYNMYKYYRDELYLDNLLEDKVTYILDDAIYQFVMHFHLEGDIIYRVYVFKYNDEYYYQTYENYRSNEYKKIKNYLFE